MTGTTPQTAEQMVAALQASIDAEARKRESFDEALDTVANAIALAREASFDAAADAPSPEARELLELMMAQLKELADSDRAESSSGLMCEIYEGSR